MILKVKKNLLEYKNVWTFNRHEPKKRSENCSDNLLRKNVNYKTHNLRLLKNLEKLSRE